MRGLRLIVLIACALVAASAGARADIKSYAIVQDDASLLMRGKTIRLAGIYIPSTGQICNSNIRPVRCAPRAAQALEFIIRGFVHCQERGRFSDGSLSAFCWVGRSSFSEGRDLGAYLISQGWAMARPDGPFEYQALEDIARSRGLGLWGFQADDIRRRKP